METNVAPAPAAAPAPADLLRGSILVSNFTPEEWAGFAPYLRQRTVPAGGCILEENVANRDLIFLVEGCAEVRKLDAATGASFVVGVIEAVETIGEISLITGEPTGAAVQAGTDCRVLFIDRTGILASGCYPKLVGNLVRQNSERLKRTNADYVQSLGEQVRRLENSKEFGRVFIVTVILSGLKDLIHYDVEGVAPLRVILSSWGSLMLMFVPILYVVLRTKASFATYGISRADERRSVREGLLISAVIVPVFLILKTLTKPGEPLVTFHFFAGWSVAWTALYFILYTLHCYIQEFIARGVMQGALERFMFDAHYIKPIFIASMMFGMLHLQKSFEVAFLTFAMSFGFGLIYSRHKNLIGVSIVHYVLGFVAQALGYL